MEKYGDWMKKGSAYSILTYPVKKAEELERKGHDSYLRIGRRNIRKFPEKVLISCPTSRLHERVKKALGKPDKEQILGKR